jgi:hypothetical protein
VCGVCFIKKPERLRAESKEKKREKRERKEMKVGENGFLR